MTQIHAQRIAQIVEELVMSAVPAFNDQPPRVGDGARRPAL